jgi:hypothetical protein
VPGGDPFVDVSQQHLQTGFVRGYLALYIDGFAVIKRQHRQITLFVYLDGF